jgi:paired amphipathic helix protein Sin3a
VKSVDDKWRPAQKKGAETKEEQVSKEAADANAEKLHEEFMQLVYRLIDGTTDVSQYEDECRHLLGAKAYILFTVDKLIYKLVKQIQSIVTDELLLKLQSLYSYEKQRQDNLFDDSVYYANSLVLLHDETRFRIGVMEKNKVSAQILDMSVNKCDIPAVAMDKAFSDYLKNYVELDSSTSPYEPGKIFLTRTLQGLKDMNESDEHLSAELKKFYIWNGLECKLACNTSKVSYVLDTEDIMLRKGCFHSSGTKSEQLKKQKERFEKWIESASAKLDEEST